MGLKMGENDQIVPRDSVRIFYHIYNFDYCIYFFLDGFLPNAFIIGPHVI